MKCVVVNCNKSNEGKASVCSFFRFPSDITLRKKWINFCGHKKFSLKTSVVCMHHFKAEDFKNNLQYEMGFAEKRLLHDDAVPTINTGNSGNDKLYEERARRIEIRENKKTVDLLLKNYSPDLMPSQENSIDIAIENKSIDIAIENNSIDIAIENKDIDIAIENKDIEIKIENDQPEKQNQETLSSDAIVKALEKEILLLKKENQMLKDEMEHMKKAYKCDKEKMKKCLSKAEFELASVEEKLQVIFTKGQIKKLKNGNKRQTWSQDDITRSITLYTASPKMYRLLHSNQFPLPAVRTIQSWIQKV